MDASEHAHRLARIDRAMAERGLDALVVTGRGCIAQFGHLQFVAGYYPILRPAAAVLRRGAPPVLAVPTRSDLALARCVSPIADIRVAAPGLDASGSSALARLLGELLAPDPGGSPRRTRVVGLVGGEEILPAAEHGLWVRSLPDVAFLPATDLLAGIKAIKTPADIAAMERAAALADAGLDALVAALRTSSCTMREAAGAAEACIRAGGAHETLVYVSPGPHFLHRPTAAVPAPGDLLTVFVELSDADGYWVELARLVAVGDLSPEAARMAQACTDAMARARSALAVGRTGSEAYAAIHAALAPHGFASGLWYGHGVGVDHDLPVIGADETTVLQPGMVVALHPHLVSSDERLGGSIAETFVIETEGARALSRWPTAPIAVPAASR